MGYTNIGGATNFWPDNDPKNLYLLAGSVYDLADLMDQAQAYFGEAMNTCYVGSNFKIAIENIHTNAIYYDLHVASDWDLFYHISID